ncbi:MAG: hypothetical protein CSA32_05230 [Desulfobulbus propionicus]|nr:MAG: hypothetical protein CSA32_05230 [Desulfobulbus propionicus]
MSSYLFTSVSSLLAHHKRGAVLWPTMPAITPGIVFGTFCGTWLASRRSTKFLKVFLFFPVLCCHSNALSPDFSSAQAVPGSAVSGNSLYLCICAARILPKMVPPELSSGEHFGEIRDCLRASHASVFMYFFLSQTTCS